MYFSPFIGPIRAHTGPARALDEREKFKKKCTLVVQTHSLSKIVAFDLYVACLDRFNLFFRFLAEMHFRTIMKLPQKTSFGANMYSFGTSVTLP